MEAVRVAGAAGTPVAAAAPRRDDRGDAFDRLLDEALGALARIQQDAEQAARELGGGGDVTAALLAMEKADMTFQLMVEVRNRLLNAYDEIMRMQI